MSSERISSSPYQHIVDQIRGRIVAGSIVSGERLGSQRELAQRFGVARPTLLAALRVLEESGLIVIRSGAHGGAFVSGPSTDQVSDSIDLLLARDGASLEELSHFRELVEGDCAHLAVLRATSAEISDLQRMVRDMRCYWLETPDPDEAQFIDKDQDLHCALAAMAHNRVSLAVLHAINRTTNRFGRRLPGGYEPDIFRDWEDIARAVTDRRGPEARALVRQHIAAYSEILIAQDARERLARQAGEMGPGTIDSASG